MIRIGINARTKDKKAVNSFKKEIHYLKWTFFFPLLQTLRFLFLALKLQRTNKKGKSKRKIHHLMIIDKLIIALLFFVLRYQYRIITSATGNIFILFITYRMVNDVN